MEKSKKEKEAVYFIKGMHCPSCEIFIEKELLKFKGVNFANATEKEGKVFIKYEGEKPKKEELNDILKENNYFLSDLPFEKSEKKESFLGAVLVAFIIIALFFFLQKTGIMEMADFSSQYSLFMVFFLGIVASVSSCMALIGGLILSLSKQWNKAYSETNSFSKKLQPYVLFNFGRLVSYGLFGAVLGGLGNVFNISLGFTSFLVFIVSLLMIFFSLKMLGFEFPDFLKFKKGEFFRKFTTSERSSVKSHACFLGASTFFLPCGFTITAQGLALISGSALQGFLIMFFFALGTVPALLMLGFSSIKFYQNPQLSLKFSKIAGILVLFFAFYNINSQLVIWGMPNINSFKISVWEKKEEMNFSEKEQVLKMSVSSFKYKPNYFIVKAGVPVRWEITDEGMSGCTNAIISKDLFEGTIDLVRGGTAIKEFIVEKPGRYVFSCSMGMVSGVIDVIGNTEQSLSDDVCLVAEKEKIEKILN